ncbi:MAG: hypothetical protein AAGB46_18875, partial [Verrucomicrobiota bacterium]
MSELAFTLFLILSFWGFGSSLLRLLNIRNCQPIAPSIGVAVLIAIGGILNLLELANLYSILVLYVTGNLLLSIQVFSEIRRRIIPENKSTPTFSAEWIPYLAVLICGILQYIYFSSPLAFNEHDDFEKYLKYPSRMLATGTLANSKLDAIGYETLGGFSYLQSYIVGFQPLNRILVLDTFIAFSLFSLSIAFILKQLKQHWSICALGATLPLF